MKINIQLGEKFILDGYINATWPVHLAGWLLFVALGIMAVHALAATDVPDTQATVQLWGAK